MNSNFIDVISASTIDRRDLFIATATRLGTTLQNIEKDFWVCWILDILFSGRADDEPRLLFKGGTSLSKAYGLISRFSEDIDITVFREDIGTTYKNEDFEEISNKQKKRQLDKIKEACQSYIQCSLKKRLTQQISSVFDGAGLSVENLVTIDEDDPDLQTLLMHYPTVIDDGQNYIRPSIKIEAGAKSALHPHKAVFITPYIAEETGLTNFKVENVLTIEAERTFWDKVIILHGLCSNFATTGKLNNNGNRVSRHYYDIFKLLQSTAGQKARIDFELAIDCADHAKIFFNRGASWNLDGARPGSFKLLPSPEMVTILRQDYQAMVAMIFGEIPDFDVVMDMIGDLEKQVNS